MPTTKAQNGQARTISEEPRGRNRRVKTVAADQDLLLDLGIAYQSVARKFVELEQEFLKFSRARKALIEDANTRLRRPRGHAA